MPKLLELTQGLPSARVTGDPDVSIQGISYDSRLVKAGDLFVALPGFHQDGAAFIADAVRRGAAAVVTENPAATVPEGVSLVLVPGVRRALTDLSAAFFGYPGRDIRVVGVTGTDGKTTTVHLVSAVLEAMGCRTGFITTAAMKVGDRVWYNETQHTTPEPVEIYGLLRQMVDEGVDYAVVECSSHALALERMHHCEFDAAVFTNLSPEHLNFHGNMEEYLQAKARLFCLLDSARDKGIQKRAILNADAPHSAQIQRFTSAPVIWYGLGDGDAETRGHGDAQSPLPLGEGQGEGNQAGHKTPPYEAGQRLAPIVAARDIQLLPGGSRFTLETPIGSIPVETRLSGRFNVHNWLAAAAVGISQGASLEQIRIAMAGVDSVPGRLQQVVRGQPFTVVVDFAHTPQALETVLGTLRPITQGRLFVLFGLAGERDPASRPAMGALAARVADFGVFTMDDPRFEDPMAIAGQIAEGAIAEGWREGEQFLKIANREEAIRETFRRARPGDTVLLAGKGHERRQVIGADLVPWNDAEAAARILGEIGY
jgi:UDP-N-acetylmuramoyl-L-alanyl-D-glutamate--2,6-diaminopimelate ligase